MVQLPFPSGMLELENIRAGSNLGSHAGQPFHPVDKKLQSDLKGTRGPGSPALQASVQAVSLGWPLTAAVSSHGTSVLSFMSVAW